ncbi:MAG: Gfo/Idh/MocA family oxidoreductase [Saprospiraceae bacterium]|nr:Gfo/Idh/MocA family oxidoreductase [Saprospiraceae bacterium]HPG06645.1 Gfo/Idh/MocA family oxidoreductase [Saprospiraceae bacterium]
MKASRREFIRQSSTLAGGIGASQFIPFESIAQNTTVAPSDKIRMGVIGCNGMGWADMRSLLSMPEVDCVGVCDIDQSVLDRRSDDVMKLRGSKPAQYTDYRKLLDDATIDAVVIGTPDHWHPRIFVDALAAGKHIYCEKPVANSIGEAQWMLSAAEKTDRLVQIGQWQRSGPHYEQAIKIVRSGDLGNIRLVKVWAYQGWMKPMEKQPDGNVPEGVDYTMWLGPAPTRPFNSNRFHFNFRWFWDYAGGLMTDWGVHEIDIALYAMNATAPKSIVASGGKLAYPDDPAETPDTLQAVFEYDHFNMLWEHATGIDGGNYGRTEGIAFIGNNATLVVNRGGWEIIPETQYDGDKGMTVYKYPAVPEYNKPGNLNYLDLHTQNFIQAIKNNDPGSLKCGIRTGSVAAINAHMGNIAFKTGRKIYWDSARNQFKNDAEATALIQPTYHNGWKYEG